MSGASADSRRQLRGQWTRDLRLASGSSRSPNPGLVVKATVTTQANEDAGLRPGPDRVQDEGETKRTTSEQKLLDKISAFRKVKLTRTK